MRLPVVRLAQREGASDEEPSLPIFLVAGSSMFFTSMFFYSAGTGRRVVS
jgi:hypothetical protein